MSSAHPCMCTKSYTCMYTFVYIHMIFKRFGWI